MVPTPNNIMEYNGSVILRYVSLYDHGPSKKLPVKLSSHN